MRYSSCWLLFLILFQAIYPVINFNLVSCCYELILLEIVFGEPCSYCKFVFVNSNTEPSCTDTKLQAEIYPDSN